MKWKMKKLLVILTASLVLHACSNNNAATNEKETGDNNTEVPQGSHYFCFTK